MKIGTLEIKFWKKLEFMLCFFFFLSSFFLFLLSLFFLYLLLFLPACHSKLFLSSPASQYLLPCAPFRQCITLPTTTMGEPCSLATRPCSRFLSFFFFFFRKRSPPLKRNWKKFHSLGCPQKGVYTWIYRFNIYFNYYK